MYRRIPTTYLSNLANQVVRCQNAKKLPGTGRLRAKFFVGDSLLSVNADEVVPNTAAPLGEEETIEEQHCRVHRFVNRCGDR